MDLVAEQRTHGGDVTNHTGFPIGTRLLAWADRNRRWVFVAILSLYAAAFTGRWRVSPDSSLYMSLGRNLAEGAGFVYQGVKHTWFEPGLPLIIAASDRLFGQDHYVPILLFILLCSLTSLALTYRLMLRHAGRPTAVLVTTGMALCETCLRYGFQVVTDTPFLVAMLVYLLGYERLVGTAHETHVKAEPTNTRSNRSEPDSNFARTLQYEPPGKRGVRQDWLGWPMIAAATFLMVTFRPTTITFVGAVGLACAWHLLRGPNRWRHVLIGLVTLGCFLGFRLVDPRRTNAEQPVVREQRLKDLLTTQRSYFLNNIATVTAPGFVEEILPEAIIGTELAPGVDTVVSLAVIAAGLALVRRRVLWGAWVGATFFQCMAWLPRERYILPILPLLVYGMWLGLNWLASRPWLPPAAARVMFVGLVALFVAPNVGYDVNFLIEQRRVGTGSKGTEDRETAPVVEMARAVAREVGEQDIVFATDHREMSYFSRRRVEGSPWSYRWPPTTQQTDTFFAHLKDAPALYVVLPDKAPQQHLPALIEKLGMRTGQAVATVERPSDRKGRPLPPFVLYRLEPAAPTTTPAVERPR